MVEEIQTRPCASCGWPALATARRCPYCREPFPRLKPVRVRRGRDPLRWMVIAWTGVTVPLLLVAVAALGLPMALLAVLVSLAPALFVWLLRRRGAMRIGRLTRRQQLSRTSAGRGSGGDPVQSGNPPSDLPRR